MRICFSMSDIIGVDDSQKNSKNLENIKRRADSTGEHELQSHICATPW